MFEDMTYESILQGMLDRVTQDVDKREGSVIYDALAPCAYYLADAYFRLSYMLDLLFADTAVGEYLDRCVADVGMTRKPASRARRKVTTSGEIPIESLWGIGSVTFRIVQKTQDNEYIAECTETGTAGNQYAGELSSLSGVTGVQAVLGGIVAAGSDEESDEALRGRWRDRVQLPATSGNKAHYRLWARSVPGVGDARVQELWNGPGTVRIIVVGEDYQDDTGLAKTVQDYIETQRPVGAAVTVVTPVWRDIAVSAQVQLDGTADIEAVKAAFGLSLKEYLLTATKEAFSADTAVRVSYARVGNVLLDTPGVTDYDALQINGTSGNITLAIDEAPRAASAVLTSGGA